MKCKHVEEIISLKIRREDKKTYDKSINSVIVRQKGGVEVSGRNEGWGTVTIGTVTVPVM